MLVGLPLLAAGLWVILQRVEAPVAAVSSIEAEACSTLTQRLCGHVKLTTCALARERLVNASESRCSAMLEHYGRTARELRELAAAIETLRAPEPRTAHGEAPRLGPREAELTLTVFADFQSEHCGRAAPMARNATQRYPGRVRVVFRQAPSPGHPDARLAAQASLAAHAQGKFWPYHDLLFANPQDLGRAALERHAVELGLDMDAFRRALDTELFAPDVDEDVRLARTLQVTQRPALFMNEKAVSMPFGLAELEALIDGALLTRRDTQEHAR